MLTIDEHTAIAAQVRSLLDKLSEDSEWMDAILIRTSDANTSLFFVLEALHSACVKAVQEILHAASK